jgi:squalene-hopene/tetraprenyl-beta-curcumene cyclase
MGWNVPSSDRENVNVAVQGTTGVAMRLPASAVIEEEKLQVYETSSRGSVLVAKKLGCERSAETATNPVFRLSRRSVSGQEALVLGVIAFLVVVSAAHFLVVGEVRLADRFIWPVLGDSVENPLQNIVDPREDGWYVSNGFGNRCPSCSNDPNYVFHPGEDWNRRDGDANKPVYAIADGEVIRCTYMSKALGWAVIVKHVLGRDLDIGPYTLSGTSVPVELGRTANTIVSAYLHLNTPRFGALDASAGDSSIPVSAGDLLGTIYPATSGGAHLHFEIRRWVGLYESTRTAEPGNQRNGYYSSWQDITNFGYINPATAEVSPRTYLGDFAGSHVESSLTLFFIRSGQTGTDQSRTDYQVGDTQEKWVRVTAGDLSGRVVKTYVQVTMPNGDEQWAYHTASNFDPSEPLQFSSAKTPLYPGTWTIQDSNWHWNTYTFDGNEQPGHWTWQFSYEDASTGTVLLSSEAAYEVVGGMSSIGKGLQWLRTSQKSDGSWSGSTGITALVLLSFFNAGIRPDDTTDTNGDGTPDLQKGMAYLASKFDQTAGRFFGDAGDSTSYYCYDTALCLLALVAADRATGAKHYQDVITRAKDYLISVQFDDDQASPNYGGWGYPRSGWADLSNTQWVVMALDAAYDYLGLSKPIPSDPSSWAGKLLSFLDQCQMPDGGFDYQASYFDRSLGSMSFAGLWSLLLAGLHEPESRIGRVRDWIAANYTLDENPGRGLEALYYYYVTLAKALTMAGWDTIATPGGVPHEWYAELVSKLEALQKTDGYWVNEDTGEWEGNADLCTAYALLALETQQLPSGEQLSWVLTLHSPGTLHVYDPDGAHVGPNEGDGGVDEDVPGSSYEVTPAGEQVITISGLQAGSYRVELVGTSGGTYTLESEVRQSGQAVSVRSFTGALAPGQVRATRVVFTAMEGAVTQFMQDLQAVPSGLRAASGNQTVTVTWNPFDEAGFSLAGYNVYRSTTAGGEYLKVTASPIVTPSYRDVGLINDVTYYYVVTAVSSAGDETAYSREVHATPSVGAPGETAQIICGPNPVRGSGVTFYYRLPEGAAEAEIVILDLSGRLVFRAAIDFAGSRYPGSGTWDPVNFDGAPLGNGAYVFVLVADGKVVGRGKMVIQR